MRDTDCRSNIWKINLLQVLRWFFLIMPVIVLFYKENGLSMQQVMILQAVYSVTMVLFEVPSGYFSDTLGRRNCLVMGCVLGTAGFSVYSFSHSFAGFLIAELALGLGQSFISGTDAALLYDTLLELQGEQTYTKHQGRLSAIGNFSESIAGIVGGFIAVYSLRMNLYIEAAVMACAIPVALSIKEPRIHEDLKSSMTWKGFFAILKDIFQSPGLCWLIIHNAVVLAATLTIVWFVQPYLKVSGIPLALFGIIWTVLNISVGASSMIAHRIEKNVSTRTSFIMPVIMILAGYMLLGMTTALWACAFIIILYCVRGFCLPVFSTHINRQVTTDMRATVLSIRVLLTRLIFSIVGPLLGWMSDAFTLHSALVTAGIIFFTLGTVSSTMLLRHHR